MKRLEAGSYRDLHYFVSDVHLTFNNAMTFNPKNSDVFLLSKNLKREFDIKYKQKTSEFEKMIEIMRRYRKSWTLKYSNIYFALPSNPEACLICGEGTLKFEPPVYYCNGTCSQKIRRNATFYSNDANTYHWCSPCYGNLKDSQPIRLPGLWHTISFFFGSDFITATLYISDCNIAKADLKKRKHIEDSEEGWVQCEGLIWLYVPS